MHRPYRVVIPAKAGIQSSPALGVVLKGGGILDRPPSRAMTVEGWASSSLIFNARCTGHIASSYPRKRVSSHRRRWVWFERRWNTGSPAFAGDDGWRRTKTAGEAVAKLSLALTSVLLRRADRRAFPVLAAAGLEPAAARRRHHRRWRRAAGPAASPNWC
jgi:hypothetical protein